MEAVGSISLSATLPTTLPPDPAPQFPAEVEDPNLGKRKASQIVTDQEATPSVAHKRKKRRKVGSEQPMQATDNSTITAASHGPRTEQGTASESTTPDVTNTKASVSVDQPTVSTSKKKGKNTGTAQTDSTPAEVAESHTELVTELADAPNLPPAEPSRTKKRKKTVILELSTVIPSPATTQVRMDLLPCEISGLWSMLGTGASCFKGPVIVTQTRDRAFAFLDAKAHSKALDEENQSPGGDFKIGPQNFPHSSPECYQRTCFIQFDLKTETARQ